MLSKTEAALWRDELGVLWLKNEDRVTSIAAHVLTTMFGPRPTVAPRAGALA